MTNYYRALPILLGLIVAAASNAYADIGQIKNVSGAVFVLRQNVEQPAKAGDLVQQSDVLITGATGAVGLTFIDGSRSRAAATDRCRDPGCVVAAWPA